MVSTTADPTMSTPDSDPTAPSLHQTTVPTPYGALALTSTHPLPLAKPLPAILFLHGNSSSSRIFHPLFRSRLATPTRALLAFDLPGHGASTDAPDPEDAYTMPAYARAAALVLHHAGVTDVVVVGWSLGGHNGIEMLALSAAEAHGVTVRGLVMTGTPPTARGNPDAGFRAVPGMRYSAARDLSDEECRDMAKGAVGRVNVQPWMAEATRRTDGRAREVVWRRWREGYGCDQMEVVGRKGGPLVAVINGTDEYAVSLDFVDGIKYGNLWKEKCFRIDGATHAPFWEKEEEYLELLDEFVQDCGI